VLKKRIFCLIILSQLTFVLLVKAQDYLWPTDAGQYISSSFAEYRPGHFHAGIDVKTWGQEGYKVFAIQDGYISKIRVSPFGYGKALYLTLNTGEIIIYGHLQKFNDQIEQYVKNEQKRQVEYTINNDLNPSVFPVKKGDLIAYTGSTGIGLPHLHFEVRDPKNNPVNPFLLGYKIEDSIPPQITAISVSPLTPTSRVNADVVPVIIKPKWLSRDKYIIEEEILVSGSIGFGVDCFDQANGASNSFAVYRTFFYVNGELKFSSNYSKFTYDNTELIDLDRDYRLFCRGVGTFQKLYKEKQNLLTFYRPPGEIIGILDCNIDKSASSSDNVSQNQGLNQFKIEVYDFNGNFSTLEGKFRIGERKKLVTKMETDNLGQLHLIDVLDQDGQLVKNPEIFVSTDQGKNWRKYVNSQNGNGIRLPSTADLKIIKVTADDMFNYPVVPQFQIIVDSSAKLPPINFKIDKDFYDGFCRIELTVSGIIKESPRLLVQQIGNRPTEVALTQLDFNRYMGAYEFIPGKDGPVDIEAYALDFSNQEIMSWDQFVVATISPGTGGSYSSKDGKCKVEFAPNAVYQNLFLRMNENIAPENKNYDYVSSIYEILPQDIPLKNNGLVALSYPSSDSLPGKLAIFLATEKKGWRFLGNSLNKANNTISAKLSGLANVVLIRDVIPPEIYIRFPRNFSYSSWKKPSFRASITDDLSGIADERSMVMKLDDKKVIAEYDPEERTLEYIPEEPLSLGEHTLSVWAIDNCDNQNIVNHTFTIVRGQ
jgi:hypothetical protein